MSYSALPGKIAEALSLLTSDDVVFLPKIGDVIKINEQISSVTSGGGFIGFVQPSSTFLSDTALTLSTGGQIKEGNFLMYLFGNDPNLVLAKVESILKLFGMTTEVDELGQPGSGPYTTALNSGSLKIYRFVPAGSFSMFAENKEGIYLNRQLIDFQIEIIT